MDLQAFKRRGKPWPILTSHDQHAAALLDDVGDVPFGAFRDGAPQALSTAVPFLNTCAQVSAVIADAAHAFAADVRSGAFPTQQHTFSQEAQR